MVIQLITYYQQKEIIKQQNGFLKKPLKQLMMFYLFLLAPIAIFLFADQSSGNAVYTYDETNRLTNVKYSNGTLIHFTYDEAGNMTGRKITNGIICAGDFDEDGDVDGTDLANYAIDQHGIPDQFADNFGKTICP